MVGTPSGISQIICLFKVVALIGHGKAEQLLLNLDSDLWSNFFISTAIQTLYPAEPMAVLCKPCLPSISDDLLSNEVMACVILRTPAPFIISPPREETVLVPAPDLLQRQGREFRCVSILFLTTHHNLA